MLLLYDEMIYILICFHAFIPPLISKFFEFKSTDMVFVNVRFPVT